MYFWRYCFHSLLSISSLILLYLLWCLFSIFHNSVSSSFHHHLLNGHVIFVGVVSSSALVMAVVILSIKVSTLFAVIVSSASSFMFGKYSLIFCSRDFQSAFKL